MKILYYATAYYARHGGSNHAKAFVEECKAMKAVCEVSVYPEASTVHPAGGSEKKSLKSVLKNNSVVQLLRFFRRNRFHLSALKMCVERLRPDVIHIRLDSNFLQIKRIKRWFPDIVISTEVNASPFDESFGKIAFRSFFCRLERKYLGAADLNFFVSANLRKRIMQGNMDHERDHVVHNGVDPILFRPVRDKSTLRKEKGISQDSVVLGYIGTLDVHKRVHLLLECFKAILANFSSAKLFIVGDGPALQPLKDRAVALGIQNETTFTGLCKHTEIPGYINCFDIAIHHRAGAYMSPLKIFEYLACEVPVIGPDTLAVREVFEDGVHLLFTDGTVEDVKNKVIKLLGDKELSSALASNGRRLVEEKYTWRNNADFIVSAMHSKRHTLV